jgi:PAS domain-containing protein
MPARKNNSDANSRSAPSAAIAGELVRLETASAAFFSREVLYRDLLNALPAAIYTTDAEGRITFFNAAAVGFAGRQPALGEAWCVTWKLFNLDGTPLPHDQCPMAQALRERRPIHGAQAIAERPDGTRLTFQPFPTPFFNAEGELLGAVNMLVDITERQASEERQRELSKEVDHRANNLLAVVSRPCCG